MKIKYCYLPFKSGAIRKIVKHPVFENCPKHVSIKNNGIPQNVNINKYGKRKAPANNNFFLDFFVIIFYTG